MADPSTIDLVSTDGSVTSVLREDAPGILASRNDLSLATPDESHAFAQKQQARQEEGGTLGAVKAFGEGAADTATLGLSMWAEKGLGADPARIKLREELHPVAHGAGQLGGIIAPAIASAGASLLPEAAGVAVKGVAELAAPSLIARAGEWAAGKTAIETAQTLTGALAKGASRGAVEGAWYGAGQAIHADALADPKVSGEALLWQNAAEIAESALAGGVIGAVFSGAGGALGKASKRFTSNDMADKVNDWANERLFKTTGGIQGDLNRSVRKFGGKEYGRDYVREIVDDASNSRLGFLDAWTTPQKAFDRTQAFMEESGPEIDGFAARADAKMKPSRKAFDGVIGQAKKDIVPVLEEDFSQPGTARSFNDYLDGLQNRYKDQNVSLVELHTERKRIDNLVHNMRRDTASSADPTKDALRGLRGIISDEINNGIDGTLGESREWKRLNRDYHVAAAVNDWADKGINREWGNNQFGLSSTLGFVAGAAMGGPLGALASGAAIHLLRKYGSGIEGVALKGLASLLRNEGPETLAAVRAVTEAAAKAESEAPAVAPMAESWDHPFAPRPEVVAPSPRATPSVGRPAAPSSDVLAGMAQETRQSVAAPASIEQGNIGGMYVPPEPPPVTPPPTPERAEPMFAPLPRATEPRFSNARETPLPNAARAGESGNDASAKSVFAGMAPERPMAPEVRASADVASALDDTHEQVKQATADFLDKGVRGTIPKALEQIAIAKTADLIQQSKNMQALTQNPDRMMNIMGQASDSWRDHAPQTAQALAGSMSRAVAQLGGSAPQQKPTGPLSPPVNPSKADLIEWAQKVEVFKHPMDNLFTRPDLVRQFYPGLMEKVVQPVILNAIAQRGADSLTYRQKIALSPVVGQDLTGDQEAAFWSLYAQATAPQPKAHAPRASSTAKMTLGGRLSSSTRAIGRSR